MSVTWNQLITRAARTVGIIGQGMSLTGAETIDAQSVLNEMLASFNREHLMIFRQTRTVITWPAGIESKTIGATGYFTSIARPDKIYGCGWILNSGQNQLEHPIYVLQTWQEYQLTRMKKMQSTLSLQIYYDATMPDGTLYPWPVPSVNLDLALYTWAALSEVTNFNTAIVLPSGYERMIKYNLAVELGLEFNCPASQQVIDFAMESRGNVKRLNSAPLLTVPDPMSMGNSQKGAYNWKSDSFQGPSPFSWT